MVWTLDQPDWGDSSHSIAFTAELKTEMLLVHVILNAYWNALDFELPRPHDCREIRWRRWIDTFLDSPNDIHDWWGLAAL